MSGQPRLARFYTPLDIRKQQDLIKKIHTAIVSRPPGQSNFLTIPEPITTQNGTDEEVYVVYRQYSTLNFVAIVDEQESQLGMLDLIHVYVQALDKCFTNVCERDVVFGWETVETVLEDLIQGGMVLETNPQKLIEAVDSANGHQSSANTKSAYRSADNVSYSRWGPMRFSWDEETAATASKAWTDMTSTLRSYLPGR